jgi:hypothetical protein
MPLREDVDGIHRWDVLSHSFVCSAYMCSDNAERRFGPQSHETVSKWEKDGREYPFGASMMLLGISKNKGACPLRKKDAESEFFVWQAHLSATFSRQMVCLSCSWQTTQHTLVI